MEDVRGEGRYAGFAFFVIFSLVGAALTVWLARDALAQGRVDFLNAAGLLLAWFPPALFYLDFLSTGQEEIPIRVSPDVIHFPSKRARDLLRGRTAAIPTAAVESVAMYWGPVVYREVVSVFLVELVLRMTDGSRYAKMYHHHQGEITGKAGELASRLALVFGPRLGHFDVVTREPLPSQAPSDLSRNPDEAHVDGRKSRVRGPGVAFAAMCGFAVVYLGVVAIPSLLSPVTNVLGGILQVLHVVVLVIIAVVVGTLDIYIRLNGKSAVPVLVTPSAVWYPRDGAWNILLRRCRRISPRDVEGVLVRWITFPTSPDASVSWVALVNLRTSDGKMHTKPYRAGASDQVRARADVGRLVALLGTKVRQRNAPVHGLPAAEARSVPVA